MSQPSHEPDRGPPPSPGVLAATSWDTPQAGPAQAGLGPQHPALLPLGYILAQSPALSSPPHPHACPRSVPAHRTGCWELRPQHSPLADDLGVRFHQVVGDVPARQVQQDVTRASLHLPGTHRRMDTRPLHPPPRSTASTRGLPVAVGALRLQGGTWAASCAPPARCTGTGGTAQPTSSSHAAALPAWPEGPGAARSRRGGTLVGTAPSCSPGTVGTGNPIRSLAQARGPEAEPPSQPRAPLTPPLPPSCTWCRSPARPGGRPAAEPCRGPPGRHRCKGQRCEMVAWRGGGRGVGTGFSPEEGELVPVHPGLEAQRRVLPEGRHDEAEEQRDADEDSGQDDLWGRDGGVTACSTPSRPIGAAPTGRTCAKNPRVLRRAWSSRLVKRARSCWRVSAQPRSRRSPSAAPRSRSVSCGSSAARV